MKNPSPKKNVMSPWILSGLRPSRMTVAIGSVVLLLAACGGDSGNASKADGDDSGISEPQQASIFDYVAEALDDLPICSSKREGMTAYIAEKPTTYLCQNNSWVELSENATNLSSNQTDTLSSAKEPTSSSAENDASSSSEEDPPKGFIREDISVTGVAQKGPFKFGSPLNLYELKKDLKPSGREYKDEISSNKGNFVIPKVSLAYPYAKLEVRGVYRNEVTGEWSTDSMTLRALTDFSEERTEVNINLLTHLEYDRVLYLVQEKGYSVYAAKKQAAQEIMTAFEFATAVTYSENFVIFQNEGVSANTVAGNGTLLAISALVMGNRSDAEIQSTIDKFREDIKTDGEWNDLQTKATMADWAYDFDYSTIRASVKSWNILDIPDYETYLDIYWNNVYGLGGCSVNRKDVVAPNSNKLSKNYNKYFICNSAKWVDATTYQKDTYVWSAGKSGELKKGNVTDTIYVYNGTKWEVSERETTIGLCQNSNAGVVSKFDGVYYICKNNAWGTATVLEYDTYGLTGVEGDIKAGVVNKDKYYVYENGTWRAAANDQEIALGVCTSAREGVVAKVGDTYYICRSKTWTTATALEYDTYGWDAGTEGEVRTGSVNTNNYYVYENGAWRASANALENNLGACVVSRVGEVGKYGNTYYICRSNGWKTATALEYDTYGKTCLTDGSIVAGNIVSSNKYVCDTGGFRNAETLEISLNKGCVSYTEGNEIRKSLSAVQVSIYHCNNNLWNETIETAEGYFTDLRDKKPYKMVTIGTQTWMAENLNYSDSSTYAGMIGRSWCPDNREYNCRKYGRWYNWAAAMDSAARWHSNGWSCGYKKSCFRITYPVRGICPEGWHLPSRGEFDTLFTAVGGISTAGIMLKSTSGWASSSSGEDGNGTDAYGFNALPSGHRSWDGEGSYSDENAYFWTSSRSLGNEEAYEVWLSYYNDYAYFNTISRNSGLSVRCIKNSN